MSEPTPPESPTPPDVTPSDVDDYYSSLFFARDEALEAGLAAAAAAGLPAIQVTEALGRLLELLARLRGARRILEVGLLGGYSTTWLARALPPGGSLVSLELSQHHADVARANLARAGVSELVEIRIGPASDSLAALETDGAGPFDLVFIDADKSGYADYFERAVRLSAPGTLIVIDNVVRAGKVLDGASDDANVQGVRRMNERIAATPGLLVTTLQLVGAKGWDGLTLALVTA